MNRRTFLKISVQLVALLASWPYHRLVAAAGQTTSEATPYGSGAYNQGIYPGYHQFHLPIVRKEGQ
jgi:hypothetical protein